MWALRNWCRCPNCEAVPHGRQRKSTCVAASVTRYGGARDAEMRKQIVIAALMASVVYMGISVSVESDLFRKAVNIVARQE